MMTEEQLVKNRVYQRRYYAKHRDEILERGRIHRESNPEKEAERHAVYRRENRDIINARLRAWQKAHPEQILKWAKKWQKNNRAKHLKQRRALRATKADKENARTKEWRRTHMPEIRAYDRKHRSEKMASDPRFAMRHRLRNRIQAALRAQSGMKAKKTMQLIGCSVESLKIYIESKFRSGMTWENWGSVWHMDHIIPCAIFDLTKPEHQIVCFHFSNLQPLLVRENILKRDSVPEGFVMPC